MTWEIFLGISALLAFVLVFMKVARDLSGSITELACAINSLKERFDDNQAVTTKRLDAHGKQIDDHEKRITKCEEGLKKTDEKVKYFHDV
jgi:hypothetical protein